MVGPNGAQNEINCAHVSKSVKLGILGVMFLSVCIIHLYGLKCLVFEIFNLENIGQVAILVITLSDDLADKIFSFNLPTFVKILLTSNVHVLYYFP